MSNGLYSGVSGLALGVGLYKDVSGLWSGANGLIAGFGGDGSTLSLNFINAVYEAAMTAYNFQQLINFTRTSSATFVGSNGLIQNTPQSVNLLTFTQQFDNAAWTRSNVTATANVVTAPDGTLTADKLEVTTTAGAQLYQALTGLANVNYTYSIYAKQGSGPADSNTFGVRNNTASVNFVVVSIDYSTGALTQTVGTGATATNVGDGWWRIVMPFTLAALPSDSIRFHVGNNGLPETAGEFCYVWGAQVEEVPAANETLGSELRSAGAIGLIGTATAATYNTTTGVGSATRVDLSNQSFVQWSGLSTNPYKLVISCDSGPGIFVRSGASGGGPLVTVAVGTSATIDVLPATGLITITSSNTGTSTFTLTSIREITAITGMPSTYTRNVGGLFPPRFDYDPITLQPRGLLIEEQRTNLFLRSEDFAGWSSSSVTVSVDSTVAPDGTTTADTLTSAASTAYVFQNASFTGDGTKSVSVFLKAGTSTITAIQLRDTTTPAAARALVNITWSGGVATAVASVGTVEGLDPYPNGWYRLRILAPGVIAANANQLRIQPDIVASPGTGSVIAWGAQTENGAFATSYIPTVASQVTRTADLASIEAPMFAPWYNATEGAFVVQFSPTVVDNDIPFSVSASGGYANSMYTNADNASQFIVVNASVAQPQLDAGTITAGATNSIAAAYKLNDFAVAVNGGTATTSTSGAIPTVDRAFIGGLANNTVNRLNGVIRSIKYYPTRLSNAQLQALSV